MGQEQSSQLRQKLEVRSATYLPGIQSVPIGFGETQVVSASHQISRNLSKSLCPLSAPSSDFQTMSKELARQQRLRELAEKASSEAKREGERRAQRAAELEALLGTAAAEVSRVERYVAAVEVAHDRVLAWVLRTLFWLP